MSLVLLAILLLFVGTASAATVHVTIKNYQYQPGRVTINRGDTVTWTNMDPVSHTVTFKDTSSPYLKNGETYSRAFNNIGTFDYTCKADPKMKGIVIVK